MVLYETEYQINVMMRHLFLRYLNLSHKTPQRCASEWNISWSHFQHLIEGRTIVLPVLRRIASHIGVHIYEGAFVLVHFEDEDEPRQEPIALITSYLRKLAQKFVDSLSADALCFITDLPSETINHILNNNCDINLYPWEVFKNLAVAFPEIVMISDLRYGFWYDADVYNIVEHSGMSNYDRFSFENRLDVEEGSEQSK